MSQPAIAPTKAAPAAKETPKEAPAAKAADADDGDEPASTEAPASTETPADATDDAATTETALGTAEERLDAAEKAFEKGDLKALAKAFGKDTKLPEPTLKAFRSISRREAKLKADTEKHSKKTADDKVAIDKAKGEIASESARVSNLLRQIDQKHSWVIKTEKAWDAEDWVGVAKGIEKLCKGASLATITQKLAAAGSGTGTTRSTADRELSDREAELKRREDAHAAERAREQAERDKAASAKTTTERRTESKTKFGQALAKHPFLANPDEPGKVDPDALEEAFKAYEASWDGKKFTKTAKGAADELHARELRRIKRLGLVPAAAAPAPAPKAKETPVPPTKTRRLPEPPPTKTGKPPSPADTLDSRIALARRITEQATRGLR